MSQSSSPTEEKKEALFYEYVTTPYRYNGKEYPLGDFGEYIKDFPASPRSQLTNRKFMTF